MKKLILAFAFMLACGQGLAASATFTAMSTSATPIPNPDRGGAGWSGFDFVTSYDGGSVAAGYSSGERLSYCLINIGAFRGTVISGGWLSSFQTSLDSMRTAGMKCAILFAYDNSASGNDDTAAHIAGHLAQLAPYFKANSDVIAFIKAGFIGAWGEWHSSAHANSCGYNSGGTSCSTANANRLTVRNALMSAVPAETHIQFRSPDDMIQWFPTAITAYRAFTGSTQSRMGFHDDCQLSANNNTGTYQPNSSGAFTSELIAYANAISAYTPYGGELANGCDAPLKTTCAEARSEFATKHLAWLKNAGGDSTWRTAWASGGCTNEIANLTGYRVRYDSLTHADTVTVGTTLTVALKLRNVGWSRVFTERRIDGKLVKSGSADIPCTSAFDLRALPAQATASTKVSVKCAVPGGATTGVYTLHLRIPDSHSSVASDRDFMIRPANTDSGGQVWDNSSGYFATGTSVTVN